ncbi:MAG TPA: contractile injection system protein, VgrG/Pvc8 family [Longimicrobium sp.]|nr:contractile injection system protein, VgrG/Pvc8 family [Longimicrobium sp.]
MPFESFAIDIGGQEADDLYADLAGVEVELSDEAPATFRLTLRIQRQAEDGAWNWVDDERFRPWSEVVIRMGYDDAGPEEVLRGYVTGSHARFSRDEEASMFEVAGVDASIRMDREEKLKDWPNRKDSDIATELFTAYGLTPQVEATQVSHDEALSTVIQRETDWQLLRRLSTRNGYGCWVEEGTGHFGPVPAAGEPPQPLLAAFFGDETNLLSFSATVDGLRPAQVAMHQVDRLTKEVVSAEATTATRDPLGSLDAAALLPAGIDPAKVIVSKNAATGVPEMTALVQGLFGEGAWMVSGEGEIDGPAYGHVLRPRAMVTIKGVGESHSGVWYVSWVRHAVTPDGYTQNFRARRDGLLPTGAEDFASGGGVLGLL